MNRWVHRVREVVRHVTVEPAMFLFITSLDLAATASSALWYEKVCYSLYDDRWICDNIRTNDTLEEQQNHVQQVSKIVKVLQSCFTATSTMSFYPLCAATCCHISECSNLLSYFCLQQPVVTLLSVATCCHTSECSYMLSHF